MNKFDSSRNPPKDGSSRGYVLPPEPPNLAGPGFTKPKTAAYVDLAQTGEIDLAGDRIPRGQLSSFDTAMDEVYRAIHDADPFLF